MRVFLAKTLNESLEKLDAQSQAAAKQSVYDYMSDPSRPGLQKHRLTNVRDRGFWSIRVNRDLRIILHESGDSGVVCYVDHHDAAYSWAENRRLEAHPTTGAAMFVKVDERVEVHRVVKSVEEEPPLFERYEKDYLLALGVPQEWLDYVRTVTHAKLETLIELLPEEATERLFDLADGQPVPRPVRVETSDPFAHPDAMRRFRIVDSAEDIKAALNAPWEKWIVFLHPSQRNAVERSYAGPTKVTGGAGTGKTVVALHRAAYLLKKNPQSRVLLTTFSTTLANRLEQSSRLVVPERDRGRLTVANLHKLASDRWKGLHGSAIKVLPTEELKRHIEQAIKATGTTLSPKFLRGEWEHVIQPFGVTTLEHYKQVPRAGRGTALNASQRQLAWVPLEWLLKSTNAAGFQSWDRVFHEVSAHTTKTPSLRFEHVIADEVQDFGLAELTFLRALASEGKDDLFLCGDIGQRIFKHRSPWSTAGINVRGRSTKLRLNYRTTEQIQRLADKFVERVVADNDGQDDERETLSILKGPEPETEGFASPSDEARSLSKWISKLRDEGMEDRDIAVFCRTERLLTDRVEPALKGIGLPWASLKDDEELRPSAIHIGTMHRAKGLEFKAVAVVGCDRLAIPNAFALKDLDGQEEVESVMEQERSLLYVACSRARERLRLSWTGEPSEFLRVGDRAK